MEFTFKEEYNEYLGNKNVDENRKCFLTQAEAIADLDYFMYLLSTASFSCVETYKAKEDELLKKYNAAKDNILQKTSIKLEDFFYLLKNIIFEIKDLHSHIRYNFGNINLYSAFGQRTIPYFCDLWFVKEKDGLFISKGLNKIKCKGREITQKTIINNGELYFVPVCKGKKLFYKGVIFSQKNDDFIEYEFKTDKKNVKISFHKENCDPKHLFDNYYKYNKKNVAYWIFPAENWNEESKNQFWNSIKNDLKSEKDIIFIDNRANFGGIPYEQMKIIFSLFGINKWFERKNENEDIDKLLEASVLVSYPVSKKFLEIINTLNIDDAKKKKLIDFWEDANKKNKNDYTLHRSSEKNAEPWEYNPEVKKDITFKGTIILILSNDTSSLGEYIYYFLKENLGYDKIKIIGTNSRGCLAYSNPFSYILPNSKITATLTSMSDYDLHQTNTYKKIVEGRGVIPEIWCTNDKELKKTIEYWIGCEKK